MINIFRWEDNGRFGLSFTPAHNYDGDLGRGESTSNYYFTCLEAREIFVNMTQIEEILRQRLSIAEGKLEYLKTVKGANENLRNVRKANRKDA